MLSQEEKKEMLEDAQNKRRRKDFEAAESLKPAARGLDLYISFLNSVQKIFSSFKPSTDPTIVKLNKL
jgi:hypothetical protein